MEDYKKMYEEARERMKSWAKGEHPECFNEAQKAAEFVFPELAESEDERIRKGLIAIITDFESLYLQENYSLSREEILVWLEKKGEQNPAWNEEVAECIYPKLAESEDEEIRNSLIGFLKTIASLKDGKTVSNEDFDSEALLEWAAWLGKQGEQKPTDKVEPKFKVGDWIVENITNGIFVGKITSINTCFYEVDGLDGNWYHIDFFEEELMHLWTINDAKDDFAISLSNCSI